MISSFVFEDPFYVKNSEEAIMKLSKFHGEKVLLKSYDVTDMYFAMDLGIILQLFRNKVENNPIVFQNKNKVTTSKAVQLLELYLNSTVIMLDDKLYKQKTGVCIGSEAAPGLCNIYMEEFDKKVYDRMKEEFQNHKLIMLRFVDDFDSIAKSEKVVNKLDKVMKEVGDQMKLKFTQEKVDEKGELQFLDLKQSTEKGLCVQYSQRSDKPILNFVSNHSKNVFEGIIMGALKNSLAKSCTCKGGISLRQQEDRLKKAGYPNSLIQKIKRKLLSRKPKKKWEVKRVGVAPQIHVLTHSMKKAGRDYNLQVTSRYRNKFKGLPRKIDRMRERRNEECKNHELKPFPCIKDTIYEVALSCGARYDGETGRCPNTRFKEHWDGKGSTTTIRDHIKKCKCKIVQKECKLLHDKPIKGAHARKIAEAIIMKRRAEEIGNDKIISAISVIPTRAELEFIQKRGLLPTTFNK
jgi:hypothetical protein